MKIKDIANNISQNSIKDDYLEEEEDELEENKLRKNNFEDLNETLNLINIEDKCAKTPQKNKNDFFK